MESKLNKGIISIDGTEWRAKCDGPVIGREEIVKMESMLHRGENSIVDKINMLKSLVQDVHARIKEKTEIIEFSTA